MCGIAGLLGENINTTVMDKMLEIQKHRGPDNSSKWNNDAICLGHNRLSIIDLTENANQPFFSNDKRYVIVFNGEIYNYIELKSELKKLYDFKTSSDTEVLIAAYSFWGKDCLHKLNGMFSFAIWDTYDKSLFLARDRFGVKPLYYNHSNGVFRFASEIKTIHSSGIPKTPNESVWASYYVNGSYGLPNETFWEDVNQLPGGHSMTVKEQQVSIERWYIFEDEVKKYNFNTIEINANYTYNSLNKVFFSTKGTYFKGSVSRSIHNAIYIEPIDENSPLIDGLTNSFSKLNLSFEKRVGFTKNVTGILKGTANFIYEDTPIIDCVIIGHKKKNINKATILVISSAIKNNNSEVISAKSKQLPIYKRGDMLAHIVSLMKNIVVVGSHGKTTTTSLIASIFEETKLPTRVLRMC